MLVMLMQLLLAVKCRSFQSNVVHSVHMDTTKAPLGSPQDKRISLAVKKAIKKRNGDVQLNAARFCTMVLYIWPQFRCLVRARAGE